MTDYAAETVCELSGTVVRMIGLVTVYHLRGWNLTTQAFERWTGGTPSAPNPSGQPVVGIAIERVQHAV